VWSILLWIGLTAALFSPALAHTGVGQIDSFASGIAHPLNGVDHILVMVSVGIWGVLAGGRAIWAWPVAFVATMLAGFTVAALGLQLQWVDTAIWLSIVIFGMLIALAVKVPVWLGATVTAVFAFFHGHAHGTEAAGVNLIPYAAGFACATAGLHLGGIGVGLFADGSGGKVAVRTMGGLAVLSALGLMGGLT
jgi:urease accessory protein